MFKNKNIFESIACALKGIKAAYLAEKNFKLYIVIAIVFIILNICFKTSTMEWVIFILLCFIVFTIEFLNTAIERIVDKFIMTKNDDAKYIKDVAAGAVLLMGIAFFVIEGIILIPKISVIFSR